MPAVVESPNLTTPSAASTVASEHGGPRSLGWLRSPAAATPQGERMQWTSWLIRDQWLFTGVCALGIAALSISVAAQLGSSLCGGATAAVLSLTLAPLWLPVTFAVKSHGLEITCLSRRRIVSWSHVRAVRFEADGATLYVRPEQGRLRPKPLAALRVRFPRESETAANTLRQHLSGVQEIAA